MADALNGIKNLNTEVLSKPNNVASKSAYDVVSMAVASAVQNEMMMHAGFETTTNTALTLATQKMAEAAATLDEPKVEMWQKVIDNILKNRATEAETITKFNSMVEDLVNKFPKGGS